MAVPYAEFRVAAEVVGHRISQSNLRRQFLRAARSVDGSNQYVEVGRVLSSSDNPTIAHFLVQAVSLLTIHPEYHIFEPDQQLRRVDTNTVDRQYAKFLKRLLFPIADYPEKELIQIISQNKEAFFPERLGDKIKNFYAGESEFGALHLKGFSVDGVGAATALTLSTLIGEPYVESHESDRFVQVVRPSKSEAELQTNASYNVPLLAHIENAGYHEPKGIVLICERNEERAPTLIISPHKALLAMREKGQFGLEARLWSSNFFKRPPTSFGKNELVSEHKIITGTIDRPNFHADFADVLAKDPSTRRAYEFFQKECENQAEEVVLRKGDALFMRNSGPDDLAPTAVQVMHGRGKFTPKPGASRLLYRVYVQ